jgi:hypothetical protein
LAVENENPVAVQNENPVGASDPQGPGRPDPVKVILAVNAVIAAIGGTYASTHSLAVTVVAGCVGVACAVLLAWKR